MEKKTISYLKKWFPLCWIILSGIILLLISIFTDRIQIFQYDFSEKGWALFVDIFKVPLSLFAIGIPIYGIIITIFRSQQFEDNTAQFEKQGFENNLFNLLKIHQDIINSLDLIPGTTNQPLITGRDCFKTLYMKFREEYNGNVNARKSEGLKRIQIAFLIFYENNESDLGHYYKHLFTMLKYIEDSKYQNKIFYFDIIKSQLSSFELALLFYYGLSGVNKKIKSLIEKYSLLEDIPYDHLIIDKHIPHYNNNAFGEKIFKTN